MAMRPETAEQLFIQSLCPCPRSKDFLYVHPGNIQCRHVTCIRRKPMDILYIGLGLLFFALCWGLIIL